MSLNTEKEGQEGQQTSDKLESKVLIVLQDKPLLLKQQYEKEQYLEPNVIELTPSVIPRTTSSCSYNRRNSSSLIEKNSSNLKQKFSKLSFSSLWRKSIHSDTNEASPPTTVIDEYNSNLQTKKRFRSLQNLSKASKLNNKLLSKDWCCSLGGSKGAIKAIMDKNRPKLKPTETSKIKRSSLLSASDLGSKGDIGDQIESIDSTSSVEYGNETPVVPVKFIWDHGGDNVSVCVVDGHGTKTTVPLERNDKNTPSVIEGKSYSGVWETTLNLKPGRCEYR